MVFIDNAAVPTVGPSVKLVVGITVDQMRYDYLSRFSNDYGVGGFNRLVTEGFSLRQMHYQYVPTYTGPGHASIFTGTTPMYHGIIANDWYDKTADALQYCAKDPNVTGVGTSSEAGKMSPIHLKSTTMGDELRMATQLKGKVIGVSLKDRGAILPAGRMANAAYWYIGGAEDVWATSSWYGMTELPQWVKQFNAQGYGKKSLSQVWAPLLNDSNYTESMEDNNPYELPFKGTIRPTFPYALAELAKTNNQYDLMKATPLGNTMTMKFAKAAILGEELGKDNIPDMLCLSFSATDYVGHQFGPQSKELQDTYIRLDRDLDSLLQFLDARVGVGNYVLFLSADHGAANNPSWMMDHKLAAGYFVSDKLEEMVESKLIKKYGEGNWVINESNQNIFLNRSLIEEKKLSLKTIQQEVASACLEMEGVHSAFTHAELSYSIARNALSEKVQMGFDQMRSGDVIYMLQPGWIEYGKQGTTHGSGYDYDTHVPAIFFGGPFYSFYEDYSEQYSISDIAPTICNILNIPNPSGCIGRIID
jgi:predicted AlkP superfamily pyrophosphatase or phosphodiesterase